MTETKVADIEHRKYCKFPDFFIITKDDVKIPISRDFLCKKFNFFDKLLTEHDELNLKEYKEDTNSNIIFFIFNYEFADIKQNLDCKNEEHQKLFENVSLLYFKWDYKLNIARIPCFKTMYPFIHVSIPCILYMSRNRLANFILNTDMKTYGKRMYEYIGEVVIKLLDDDRKEFKKLISLFFSEVSNTSIRDECCRLYNHLR